MFNLFYLTLGIVAFIGIIYLCSISSAARIVFGTILVFCIAASAVFSGIKLNQYYSAEGGIYGKIENFFGVNEAETIDDLTYKLNNVNLKPTINENEYSAEFFIYESKETTENTNFILLLNDTPCSNVKVGGDYVAAEFIYNFYDEDEQLILHDTMNIRIATYKNYTYIHLTTDGGSEAVKLWHYYFEKNDAVLKLKPIEYVT